MGVGKRRFGADFKRCPHVHLESEEIYEQCDYTYTMVRTQHNAVKHDVSCKGEDKASSMKSIKANWGVQVRLHSLKPRLYFRDKDVSVPIEQEARLTT